jgi:hypothetical protein
MPTKARRFRVIAERQRLPYRSDIVDPFGLVYRLTAIKEPGGPWRSAGPPKGAVEEPLVLWCREGETVVVELTNGLALLPGETLKPEPHAPEVPLDKEDRPVSSHVSMHADLVRYEIRKADGTNAGLNPVQTVPPGASRTYMWDTTRPDGAREPLGPVLLQDMADFRNHRHHGLVGALVVLPDGATPLRVQPGQATASPTANPVWYGTRVTVEGGVTAPSPDAREEHMVLLMQDGLRLFMAGRGTNVGFPLPDPPEEEPGGGEKEDQGQKGFNYRTEPLGPVFDPQGNPYTRLRHDPATPIVRVPEDAEVRLHLVGACDKPRHHSFTVHGVAWPEDRFQQPAGGNGVVVMVSSESAISCGTVRTFAFKAPAHAGNEARDLAYRSGVLKWDVPQGMWGILRVGAATTTTR